MLEIRLERPEDYAAVYHLNQVAFDGDNEARLVEKLRNAPGSLSMVALHDGLVVGHILFSEICIEQDAYTRRTATSLAPMAVLPDFQHTGIGTSLVKCGLKECRQLGMDRVVVLGHPEYYPRFGFEKASSFGITCPFDVPDGAFMALELIPGALAGVTGVVRYPAAFAETVSIRNEAADRTGRETAVYMDDLAGHVSGSV